MRKIFAILLTIALMLALCSCGGEPLPTDAAPTAPAVSDTDPAVSDTDPAVSDTDPAVSDTDPAVSDTDPAVSDTGEGVTLAFPEAPAADTFTMQFDSGIVSPEGEITVELVLANNPGIAVLYAYFTYDESTLELVDITNRVEDFSMTAAKAVLWDGGGDYFEDGLLATLTLRLLPGAPAGEYTVAVVPMEAVNWNFGDVPVEGSSFTIKVG